SVQMLLSLHAPSVPVIYTLSLHDALPIFLSLSRSSILALEPISNSRSDVLQIISVPDPFSGAVSRSPVASAPSKISIPQSSRSRSEEHTSELQSRENLVCRLLLEKKKKK